MRPVLVCVLLLLPVPAAAQLPDHPISNDNGTATLGAEVSGSLSRRDNAGFFNYTDYDNDALRMARLRLTGEWRPHAQLSFLSELRAGTNSNVELAALFARWRPVARWNFDVQAGRVPPVIGAFARRAYGRDNPLVGIPLAYQYLTSLRPDALPATVDDLLRMRAAGARVTRSAPTPTRRDWRSCRRFTGTRASKPTGRTIASIWPPPSHEARPHGRSSRKQTTACSGRAARP